MAGGCRSAEAASTSARTIAQLGGCDTHRRDRNQGTSGLRPRVDIGHSSAQAASASHRWVGTTPEAKSTRTSRVPTPGTRGRASQIHGNGRESFTPDSRSPLARCSGDSRVTSTQRIKSRTRNQGGFGAIISVDAHCFGRSTDQLRVLEQVQGAGAIWSRCCVSGVSVTNAREPRDSTAMVGTFRQTRGPSCGALAVRPDQGEFGCACDGFGDPVSSVHPSHDEADRRASNRAVGSAVLASCKGSAQGADHRSGLHRFCGKKVGEGNRADSTRASWTQAQETQMRIQPCPNSRHVRSFVGQVRGNYPPKSPGTGLQGCWQTGHPGPCSERRSMRPSQEAAPSTPTWG